MHARSSLFPPFTRALAALAACVLAAACATSTEPPGNGQSHWLEQCDENADCGDLSCICGVCSILCANDDACPEDHELSCESAAALSTADDCEGDPAEIRMCVSAALAPADDAAVSDAEALDADIRTDAELRDAEGDAEGDAAEDDAAEDDASEPEPPVILPLDGFDISCETIADGELAPEVDLIETTIGSNFGQLFASEAAVMWGNNGTASYSLVGSTDVTSFVESIPGPVLEGSDFFYFAGATLTKRSLSGGEPVTLESEQTGLYASVIAPTSDAVYWVANDASDSEITRFFRSDREPGDTIEIGSMRAQVEARPAVLGDYLYFGQTPGSGNSEYSIARVALDGSEALETLTDPITDLGNIISNGTSLFATISEVTAPEDPPPTDHRILRVEPDGTTTTLFETNRLWWYPSLITIAADANYIYWTAPATPTSAGRALWRGRTDGTGEPEIVAHGLSEESEHYIALNSSKIYLGTSCSSDTHIISIDKPD